MEKTISDIDVSTELRFAIVGFGNIGSRHADHIRDVGKLVAICDNDELRHPNISGVKMFTSMDSMFTECGMDIDVVSICTPNYLHCEQSVQALNAGCHVLCEKPMALSTRDCSKMIKVAEQCNRRLFVVKQNRYNPPIVAVKELIETGQLGVVFAAHLNCYWNRNEQYYQSAWKGSKSLDGGCLFTQFSHFIDLLYWMVGDVEEVKSYVGNYQHQGIVEFEDSGVVALKFDNGALGSINFTINSFNNNMEGSLTLFCEKGTVKIGGKYLNELEYQNISEVVIDSVPTVGKANDYGSYQGSMSNHDRVYQNLVEVLRCGGTIGTSGIEGLKTVEIIEKIYRSAGDS